MYQQLILSDASISHIGVFDVDNSVWLARACQWEPIMFTMLAHNIKSTDH